jgi:hypothetical protein
MTQKEIIVTGWYRGDQKPVREGWYEVVPSLYNGQRRHWNGKYWRDSCLCCKCHDQKKPWRGVVKDSAK